MFCAMGEMSIITDQNGQKHAENPCDGPCPIERGMRIVGGKWTGSLLWHLKDGPVRFNDLARQLSGASKKMIAQRLKEMEDHQLITRNVLKTKPIAVEYALTSFGETALDFLEQLKDWTLEHNL